MNIAKGRAIKSGPKTIVELAGGTKVTTSISTDLASESNFVHLGFRPEDLTITTAKNPLVQGEVSLVESLGEVTNLYVDMSGIEEPVVAKIQGNVDIKRGDIVKLTAPENKLHLFDADGHSLLR